MPEDRDAEIIPLFGADTPKNDVALDLRLIKAFMVIDNTLLRVALVEFVERMARPSKSS